MKSEMYFALNRKEWKRVNTKSHLFHITKKGRAPQGEEKVLYTIENIN